MLIGFYVLLFFLGAVLGSFGGVIIERGREGFAWDDRKRVFGGRSYCPSCKTTLTRWQLIPVVGRLLQKGKCFRCKLQIPVWYLREEIFMGSIFVLTGWMFIGTNIGLLAEHAVSGHLLFWLLINWGLVLLLLADLFWYELNLYVRILLMCLSIGFQFGGVIGDWRMMIVGGVLLTAVFYGIYMFAARWQTRKTGQFTEGFGLGDVWMAALIGSLVAVVFGSGDWIWWVQLVLLYLVLSSGLGIIFWLIRKLISGNSEDQMPFLPAMIVAFWIIVLSKDFVLTYFAL